MISRAAPAPDGKWRGGHGGDGGEIQEVNGDNIISWTDIHVDY